MAFHPSNFRQIGRGARDKPKRPRDKGNPARKCAGLSRNSSALTLLDMSGDQLGHLEHADLALAIKNWAKGVVSIDLGSLFLVL
jgi:hypothetical protein